MSSKPKRLPQNLRKAILNQVDEPRLVDLVSHFFQAAGGPKRVATLIYEEFLAARPGSLMRSRIIDMILRVTKYANDNQAQTGDLELLSEEDLERQAQALILRMPGVTHAEEDDNEGQPAPSIGVQTLREAPGAESAAGGGTAQAAAQRAGQGAAQGAEAGREGA